MSARWNHGPKDRPPPFGSLEAWGVAAGLWVLIATGVYLWLGR